MTDKRNAPGVRVTLLAHERAASGEPLHLDGRILGFSFEDTTTKTDKATLQLDNFALSLFERAELVGVAVVEVSWGYPGNIAPPRRMVLKKFEGFVIDIRARPFSHQQEARRPDGLSPATEFPELVRR